MPKVRKKYKKYKYLTYEQRQLLEMYLKNGISLADISKLLNASYTRLEREAARCGGYENYSAQAAMEKKNEELTSRATGSSKYKRLTLAERKLIGELLKENKTYTEIAQIIGTSQATVSRAIKASGGPEHYDPEIYYGIKKIGQTDQSDTEKMCNEN